VLKFYVLDEAEFVPNITASLILIGWEFETRTPEMTLERLVRLRGLQL
jgi:hypothetical protein